MGNRAVIATGQKPTDLGIYLHWNGGPESVLAFMRAAKDLGMRAPDINGDQTYGMARLCQVIGNFFGGSTSIGVGTLSQLDCDNGDNGVYYIHPGWTLKRKDGAAVTCDKDQLERMEGIYQDTMEKNKAHVKE